MDNLRENVLILMLKAPESGKVKTRLGKSIGMDRAEEVYRGLVRELISRLQPEGEDAVSWQFIIAFSPVHQRELMNDWLSPDLPPDSVLVPQGEGDLGDRLERMFRFSFDHGAERTLALGADCVEIDSNEIEHAFDTLGDCPLTLGEAEDGGYWIIGMDKLYPELFRDMPWSEPNLAEATRACAGQSGLMIQELDRKMDIDTIDELERLDADTLRRIGWR